MMATSKASSLSASAIGVGLLTLARSTLTPFCNMGVMTMKMISSTSITSTMGVTLMLELTLAPSFLLLIAMACSPSARNSLSACRGKRPVRSAVCARPGRSPSVGLPANAPALQEVVNQFARRVIHLHVESFHAAREIVEHHHGRDGDEQTAGGGYQRLRNALEGVQNAHHGAEQADEGSSRTDGGQAAQAALQFGVHDGLGALQGPLGSLDLLARDIAGFGVSAEFLQAR